MKDLKIICDFGNRIDFEHSALKQGFFKIYDGFYIDVDFLHSQRIDDRGIELSEDTARITVFKNEIETFYKFGCFFISNTEVFFRMQRNELLSYFKKECRKYKITTHFNNEAVEMLIKSGIDKLFTLKNLRNLKVV